MLSCQPISLSPCSFFQCLSYSVTETLVCLYNETWFPQIIYSRKWWCLALLEQDFVFWLRAGPKGVHGSLVIDYTLKESCVSVAQEAVRPPGDIGATNDRQVFARSFIALRGKQRESLANLQKYLELCFFSRTSCARKISSHHGVLFLWLERINA